MRHGRQRRSTRCQMQKSAARKCHGDVPAPISVSNPLISALRVRRVTSKVETELLRPGFLLPALIPAKQGVILNRSGQVIKELDTGCAKIR